MKNILIVLAAFIAVGVAVTVTDCNSLSNSDCAHCTAAQIDSSNKCGWCISTVKSYCGLTSANCTYQGDSNDEWVPNYGDGGNPQCTGGCESAESCQECASKANCGYCHTGGCIEVKNSGSCSGAFTIGTCDLPCAYKDNCQNCLSTTDTYDCQWCSDDDTDPKGGVCSNSGLTCANAVANVLTDASVCAAFDVDSGSATLNFGVAAFCGLVASFLFI